MHFSSARRDAAAALRLIPGDRAALLAHAAAAEAEGRLSDAIESLEMLKMEAEELREENARLKQEHEEWERRQQLLLEQESWADLVAVHGPLMTDAEWKQYKSEYEGYLDLQWKE